MDAVDLLFNWQDQALAHADEADEGRRRGKGRIRLPWPPRDLDPSELGSNTRTCNTCRETYPETPDFFYFSPKNTRKKYQGGFEGVCLGCRRRRQKSARCAQPEYQALLGPRFRKIRNGAKRVGHKWGFKSPEDLREFYDKPCHYCGGEVHTRLALDRVDSAKGYIPSNVVQCCSTCNLMKLDHSIDEWFAHMEKILAHREQEQTPLSGEDLSGE